MGTVKYSGPVASFHCPTNAEIRSLKVHFSPKQLGEGDPSPENVREIVGWDGVEVEQRGKNLLGNLEDGYFQTFIPNGTQLIASTDIPTSGNNQVRYYRADKTEIDYWTLTESYMDGRKKRTFSTIEDAYYWRYTYMTLNVQLEYGSTATSYESCRGNTIDYEFGVLGKNKLDVSAYIDNEYVKSDGTFDTNNSFRRTDYLHLSPGNYIYSSVKNDSVAAYSRVCGYTKDKVFVSMLNEQLKNSENYAMTFTVPDNVYYIVLQSYKNTSQEQIELGSTATAYEPYDPNHTVYGGWVDLISGEVCEEWYNVNPSKWTKYNESNGYYAYRLDGAPSAEAYSKAETQFLLNIISQYGSFNSSNMNQNIIQYPNYLALQQDISVEMVEYIYKLATPLTYHLAPTQLQTFLGHNNVWSNADYVEVEYDLHETQTILARKQFIVANQPHIVKPAAAPLQNFVTDVAAPLKECKVYFSPVQEGTGDPSPDNVRPITGWTGVEVTRCGKNLFNQTYYSDVSNYTDLLGGYKYTAPLFLQPNTTYRITPSNPQALIDEGIYYVLAINKTNDPYDISGGANTQFYYPVYNGKFIVTGTNGVTNVFTTGPTGTIRFGNDMHSDAATRLAAIMSVNWQLEIGSTATTYEPYTGTTIPISFPSVTNILNSTTITTNKTLSAAGEETSETGMSVTNYIKVNEGDTYKLTFTSKEGARTRRIWSYNASKEPIEYLASVSWVTVDTVGSLQATIPSGVEYIRVCYKTADENIFLEGPESSVIYGGYVDLVTGELWRTYGTIKVANRTWNNYSQKIRYYINLQDRKDAGNVFTDTLTPNQSGNFTSGNVGEIIYYGNSNNYSGYFFIILPEPMEAQDANQWIQETYPDATVYYELKNPVLLTTLTPTTLKALRGTNNIFSSANGNIELAYWKH